MLIKFNYDEISNMSSMTLALIGDSVYDLYVRMRLLKENIKYNSYLLTKYKFMYVNAKAQDKAIKAILDILTDEELIIYKRGRNAKVNTKPKSATMNEYHNATGFEALIGYLYLENKLDRVDYIMSIAYATIKGEISEKIYK